MAAPRKYMIDTNVVDELARDVTFFESVHEATLRGRIRLLVTSIQVDELLAAPGHTWLIHVLIWMGAQSVHTAGAVVGGGRIVSSRLDMTRLLGDVESVRHRNYVGDVPRRSMDALILGTAQAEGVPLVTAERKPRSLSRMRKYFPTVELLTPDDLRSAARRR
jgi:hypothetical protein